MPAALLYLRVAIPFLSSSLNADTNEGIPSTVDSTGLCWQCSSTIVEQLMCDLVALTRHGGFVEVGSLDNLLIVCHALRLL